MKLKQILFFLLVSHFSVLLLNNPANAFNLIYEGSDNKRINYTKDNVGGELYLDDLKKIDSPRRDSRLWRVLTSSFPDWKFYSSSYPIYGDFIVNEYTVCPPLSACADPSGSVGAKLDLDYVPNKKAHNQPNPIEGNLRWIQLVISNHSLENGYAVGENVIDIDIENPDNGTPYYDSTSAKVDTYSFNDEPLRYDIDKNHNWQAFLFLTGRFRRRQKRTQSYKDLWRGKLGMAQ